MPEDVIHVLSLSLGSGSRDKTAHLRFAGYEVTLRRVGCDGDRDRMAELLRTADAEPAVDAVALGGIDLIWEVEGRRYIVREARRLAELVCSKPVVCGFGVKTTLELDAVERLFREAHLRRGQRILFMSLAERYALGKLLWDHGCEMVFGDLPFSLGIPIPLRRLATARLLARLLLPVARRMPIRFFYPQGARQEVRRPRHARLFAGAEIVAGDFLLIKRIAPTAMDGKVILTNTTTSADREMLAASGVHKLITLSPRIQGRTFGANVLEGLLAAVLRREGREPSPEGYREVLGRNPLDPAVEVLDSGGGV